MPPPSSFRRAVFPRKRPHTWNSYSTLKRRKRLRRDIRKIDNGSLRVGKWMPPTMTLNHTFKKTFRMHWPLERNTGAGEKSSLNYVTNGKTWLFIGGVFRLA